MPAKKKAIVKKQQKGGLYEYYIDESIEKTLLYLFTLLYKEFESEFKTFEEQGFPGMLIYACNELKLLDGETVINIIDNLRINNRLTKYQLRWIYKWWSPNYKIIDEFVKYDNATKKIGTNKIDALIYCIDTDLYYWKNNSYIRDIGSGDLEVGASDEMSFEVGTITVAANTSIDIFENMKHRVTILQKSLKNKEKRDKIYEGKVDIDYKIIKDAIVNLIVELYFINKAYFQEIIHRGIIGLYIDAHILGLLENGIVTAKIASIDDSYPKPLISRIPGIKSVFKNKPTFEDDIKKYFEEQSNKLKDKIIEEEYIIADTIPYTIIELKLLLKIWNEECRKYTGNELFASRLLYDTEIAEIIYYLSELVLQETLSYIIEQLKINHPLKNLSYIEIERILVNKAIYLLDVDYRQLNINDLITTTISELSSLVSPYTVSKIIIKLTDITKTKQNPIDDDKTRIVKIEYIAKRILITLIGADKVFEYEPESRTAKIVLNNANSFSSPGINLSGLGGLAFGGAGGKVKELKAGTNRKTSAKKEGGSDKVEKQKAGTKPKTSAKKEGGSDKVEKQKAGTKPKTSAKKEGGSDKVEKQKAGTKPKTSTKKEPTTNTKPKTSTKKEGGSDKVEKQKAGTKPKASAKKEKAPQEKQKAGTNRKTSAKKKVQT